MCKLYDYEENWADVWEDVAPTLKAFHMHSMFRQLDVTSPEALKTHTKLFDADLFTMIYFMSEVYSNKDAAGLFFDHLFENAKVGSIFVFVDNARYMFYNWFDILSKYYMEEIKTVNFRQFKTTIDEEKTDLEPYYSKFGDPNLKLKTAYRICRKAEEL
jgi:hypothetical protein